MENHVERLREDMCARLGKLDLVGTHNVLPFSKGSPAPETHEGTTAIDLIDAAVVMVRNLEARAFESEMRSGGILRWANEQLRGAERQIELLNAARHAAERDVRETTARAERAEQRAAVAEAELCAMLGRMNAAEAQAEEAKQALTRVEEAIRTKLLNLRRIAFNEPNLVAKAAPGGRELRFGHSQTEIK